MHQAAIVSYGTDERPENSLIYFSTDWPEFVNLLQNPVVFMGSKGMINSPVPWTLRTNTTMIVAPFDSSDQSTLYFAARLAPLALAAAVEELQPKDSPPINPFPTDSLPLLASKVRELMYGARFRDEIANGGFLAEYALITGILNILYIVPSQFKPDKDEAPSLSKFGGSFTPAMYIGQPLPNTLTTIGEFGNVHFDIDPSNGDKEINRGTLILDVIENPHRVFSRLGDHATRTATFADVVAGNGKLQINKQQVGSKPANYTFTTVRPTIVVERATAADAPDPCGVCVDGQTHMNSDGSWSIRGVIFKCYMPPG